MKPTIPTKYYYSITFSLALHIAALHHATAATFAILNNCPHTVWAAAVPGGGTRLDPGQNWAVVLPAGTGRVWARTNCSFNSWTGRGRCLTGDCDGSLQCWVHGKPPASLAEYVLDQTDGLDYLYISLVEGFNVPIELRPTSPVNCSRDEGIRCDANATNVIRRCPRSMRTRGGCRDPCTVFKADEYCCTGAMTTNCGPTKFSKFYKRRCPDAYTYPRDDETSTTITCAAGYNSYTVVFCPTPQEQGMPPIQSSPAPAPNPAYYPPPGIGQTSSSFSRPVSSHSHVETGRIAGLVLGASGAGFLLIISTACCIRKRYSRARRNLNVEKVLFQTSSLSLKRYKYSEIKKMTKSLSDKLGQGGYGSVYKGKLPDGSLVAVKVLTADTNSNGEEFINEVASISRTSHVNIVNLLGFCFERKKRALVYEYMPNKSLDKYIGGGADHLNSQTLYKIAVGVAKGLEYLHTGCNTRIVHFDIKPQNILLDEDFCPKISDFGLAKLCQKKQSLLSVLGTRGTAGYIAPEVFSRNYGGVSHKSDVYSYGMMVLEMGGGHGRVGGTETSRSKESYFPDTIYELVTDEICWPRVDGIRTHEDESRQKMCLVGFWCIQTKASDRPSMSKVVEMLEGNFQSIQIPPKPVLFTPSLPITESSSPFSSHVETEPSGSG